MRTNPVDTTTAVASLFDRNERRVIQELAEQTELSIPSVLRQALRNYQLSLSNVKDLSKLAEDNERLREGEFTEEEFQNLCHCIPEEDRDCFFTGCADFQRKLFGTSDRDTYQDALKELFSLFTKDTKGCWSFNSLSRDGAKFDIVMDKLNGLLK